MADKRLDQVTKVADMAYVPVIMSDGSIGQIAKADLATVVAGILNPVRRLDIAQGDIDSIKTPGFYEYRPTSITGNTPSGGGWGSMIVAAGGSYMITQIVFGKSSAVYRTYDSAWTDWSRIDNFGYNTLAELSEGVASNNPRTITSLRGKRLYKIGKASTWDYGSFIASVSDATGKGCSLIGISFRNMNTSQNVTYTRTGDSTLGIQVYKRIVEGTMEVFIYSSNNADSFSPMCGFSSQSVELIGEITDLTEYTLVVSW